MARSEERNCLAKDQCPPSHTLNTRTMVIGNALPADLMIASLPSLTPQVANNDTHDAGAFAALRIVIALGFLASLAITYPLWLTERAFPLIPLDPRIPAFPFPFDIGALLALGALLVASIVVPSGMIAVGIVALVALLWAQDQNRIHPWGYFFVLIYAALGELWIKPKEQRRSSDTVTLLQFIVITIYAWTGLQKFRASYFTEVVPLLISSYKHQPSFVTTALLYSTPFIEVALALGLLFQLTRKLSVVGLLILHAGILVMVSPLGRDENYSIVPWNLTMACVTVLLFWRSKTTLRAILMPTWTRTRVIFFQLCLVLPLLGYFGLWNAYLSFSVYSGASAHGYAFFQERALPNLPPTIRSAVSPSDGGLYQLSFDRWAVTTLNSPPSPQLQDVHQMALYLCRTIPNADTDMIVIIRTPPKPWQTQSSDKAYSCQQGELISLD